MITMLLTACAGQKINHKRQALSHTQPLAQVTDAHVRLALNHVWIKGDPTAWVKQAAWDEYALFIESQQAHVSVIDITLFDQFGKPVAQNYDRRQLKKHSKQIKREYQKQGYAVQWGHAPSDALWHFGTAVGLGAATGGKASLAYAGTSTSAAAGAVILAIPAALIIGIKRAVNQHQVQQILTEKPS